MTPRQKSYLYLLIVVTIWGFAGPVIKLTLKALPPDIFILYRFFISSIVAFIIFSFKGLKLPKDSKTRLEFCLYGFLNSTISLGLLFWGMSLTSLLDMSLISLFGPLLLILGGYYFLKDKVTSKEKLGIMIAFIGSAIVSISPILNTERNGAVFGNILIFLSLVATAFSGILAKKLMRKDISPDLLSNFSFVIGFITMFLFVVIKQNPIEIVKTITQTPINYQLGVFYMALISGNLAYALYNMGQKSIELSESAPFTYLHPLFSAILAVLLLRETINPPIIIGLIATLIGVVIAQTKHKLI